MNNNEPINSYIEKIGGNILIEFIGTGINPLWMDNEFRDMYRVTIKTPRGKLAVDYWDSVYNTRLHRITLEECAKKLYKRRLDDLNYTERMRAIRYQRKTQSGMKPTAYDVMSVLEWYDPGTFKNFCSEFGYDEDGRTAIDVYIKVQDQYEQIEKVFTHEQIENIRYLID